MVLLLCTISILYESTKKLKVLIVFAHNANMDLGSMGGLGSVAPRSVNFNCRLTQWCHHVDSGCTGFQPVAVFLKGGLVN